MGVKLETFLLTNLEGYLFEDIETLKRAEPSGGKNCGAVGYPLLMTVFSGIELLGNLVSSSSFDPRKGADRFAEFWRDYLYAGAASRQAAAPILYQLARHGLAHAFLVKGDLNVCKGHPNMHLTRTVGGAVSVDAVELANDLRKAYDSRIKPEASPGKPLFDIMSRRLAEMEAEYSRQASLEISKLTLPAPTTPAGTSVTMDPRTVTGSTFP